MERPDRRRDRSPFPRRVRVISRNWLPFAFMKRNENPTPRLLRLSPDARTEQAHDKLREPGCPDVLAEFRIGRAGDGDELSAALEHAEGFFECLAVLAVQDDVVVAQDILEVLRLVVDDDVCTQALHERDIGCARGRGNGCAYMLGQLDGKGADAAGAGLDEDLLPLLQAGLLDQRLPCRQAHQRMEAASSIVRPRGLSASDASLTGTNSANVPIRKSSGRA